MLSRRTLSTVRVHLPLKQGLRQTHERLFHNKLRSTSASSIKTRIKTFRQSRQRLPMCLAVRVHLPLKQGLRLISLGLYLMRDIIVRVHLPLKQGLRRNVCDQLEDLNPYECIFH